MPGPNSNKIERDLQEFLADPQNTHRLEIQHSMASLITKLKEAYESSASFATAVETCIALLAANTMYTSAQKNIITKQAEYILTLTTDHWTANQTADGEIIDTPVNLTFKLVCCALLDPDAYKVAENSTAKEDQQHRLISLGNCLLGFEQVKGTCGGGYQHDLLFLLNGCWHEFQIIENVQAFVMSCMSEYIGELFLDYCSRYKKNILALTWAWVSAQANNLDLDRQIVLFLQVIKERLSDYLINLCKKHQWHRLDIESYIQCICDDGSIRTPVYHNGVAYMQALLALPTYNDMIPNHATENGGLIRCRKEAIKALYGAVRSAQSLDEITPTLSAYIKIDGYLKKYLRYQHITLILDDADQAVITFLSKLNSTLMQYYQQAQTSYFTPTTEQLTVFQEADTVFGVLESNKGLNIVSNYFCLLNSIKPNDANDEEKSKEVSELYNQLTVYFPTGFKLTDDRLRSWLQSTRTGSGHAIVEISPYEINRILFHAMAVSVLEWTQCFIDALTGVIDLIVSALADDSDTSAIVRKQAFSAAYDKGIIQDLRLLLWLKTQYSGTNNDLLGNVAALVTQYQSVYPFFSLTLVTKFGLLNFLFSNLAKAYSERLLTDLLNQPNLLRTFISNMFQLNKLLSASFSRNYLQEIWLAIESILPDIIHYGCDLRLLEKCEFFNAEHNSSVWNAIADRLAKVIDCVDSLLALLRSRLLTTEQKEQVWHVAMANLHLIVDEAQFLELIMASDIDVTPQQYNEFYASLYAHAESLLFGCPASFTTFLALSNSSIEQQTAIWRKVLDGKPDTINNIETLASIMYNRMLTQAQYDEALQLLSDDMMKKKGQGDYLDLLIDAPTLTEEQRNNIVDKMLANFADIEFSDENLVPLTKLSSLTAKQHTQIAQAILNHKWEQQFASVVTEMLDDSATAFLAFIACQRTPQQSQLIWQAYKENEDAILHSASKMQKQKINVYYRTEIQGMPAVASAASQFGMLPAVRQGASAIYPSSLSDKDEHTCKRCRSAQGL